MAAIRVRRTMSDSRVRLPETMPRRGEAQEPPCFGSLRHPNSRATAPTKWACVWNDVSQTHIRQVADMMIDIWKMPLPRVLISVTGAAKAIKTEDFDEKQRAVFRRGLLKAARTTRAWVVTVGTAEGVAPMVGQMLKESADVTGYETPCVGIAPWRKIHLHEELQRSSSNVGTIYSYQVTNREKNKYKNDRIGLDPNHTHMLLVDDDKKDERKKYKWGAEVEMRAKLEDAVCDYAARGGLPAPMVLLVVAGGLNTLKTVLATLRKGRPVIVFADSKGCAEHMYRYHVYMKQLEQDEKNGDDKKGARQDSDHLPSDDELKHVSAPGAKDEYRDLLGSIHRLGKREDNANNSEQISFYKLNEDDGSAAKSLDDHILRSILSDCESTAHAVQHAVLWGDASIIKEQLFKSEEVDPAGLARAFESALKSAGQNKASKPALRVVRTLIEFHVCPKHLCLDNLFMLNLNTYDLQGFETVASKLKMIHDEVEANMANLREVREQIASTVSAVRAKVENDDDRSNLLKEVRNIGQRLAPSHLRKGANKEAFGFIGNFLEKIDCGYQEHIDARRSQRQIALRAEQKARQAGPADSGGAVGGATIAQLQEQLEKIAKRPFAREPIQGQDGEFADSPGPPATPGVNRFASTASSASTSTSIVAQPVQQQPAAAAPAAEDAGDGAEGDDYTRQPLPSKGMLWLSCNWMDLTIWAVFVGHREMARLLWEQTTEPLRAALIASRLSQKLNAQQSGGVNADRAEDHLEYEQWAIGVLDQFHDFTEARGPLTAVPLQKKSGAERTHKALPDAVAAKLPLTERFKRTWERSVMDEAVDHSYHCGEFITHPHCKRLVESYFHGNYAGSSATIPQETTYTAILFHIVWGGILIPFLGFQKLCLPASLRCVVADLRPRRKAHADDDSDDSDEPEEEDDDDLDLSYMMPQSSDSDGSTMLKQQRAMWRRYRFFWTIPKVKYVMHTVSFVVYLALLWLLLTNNVGWPHQTILPYRLVPGGNGPSVAFYYGVEAMVWVLSLTRGYEEFRQVQLTNSMREYLSSGWNILDVIVFLVIFICFICRCLMWAQSNSIHATGQGFLSNPISNNLIEVVNNGFAVLSVLTSFRFLEVLCISQSLGELVTILTKMVADMLPMAVIIVVISLGFGCAFATLVPNTVASAYPLEEPVFLPAWALLGDFDVHSLNEATASIQRSALAPVLLWVFTLVSTIILVNLLIAKMTSTYEKVKSAAGSFRQLQRAHIVIDYKDNRGLPPPLNFLSLFYDFFRVMYQLARSSKRPRRKVPEGFMEPYPPILARDLKTKTKTKLQEYLVACRITNEDTVDSQVESIAETVTAMREYLEAKFDTLDSRMQKLEPHHKHNKFKDVVNQAQAAHHEAVDGAAHPPPVSVRSATSDALALEVAGPSSCSAAGSSSLAAAEPPTEPAGAQQVAAGTHQKFVQRGQRHAQQQMGRGTASMRF